MSATTALTNAAPLVLAVMFLCTTGCNEGQSVSGTITVDGAPLPVGHIGFAPAEGAGNRVGSDVRDGAYTVRGLTPGSYKVYVTGTSGEQPVVKTREEARQIDQSAPKELVTLDHPENGQVVEVDAGTSTLNFEF